MLTFRDMFKVRDALKVLSDLRFTPATAVKIARIFDSLDPDYTAMIEQYERLVIEHGEITDNPGMYTFSIETARLVDGEMKELLDQEWINTPNEPLSIADFEQCREPFAPSIMKSLQRVGLLVSSNGGN